MTACWTPEELQRIGAAHELQIASRRADGTLGRWVPIWVVSAGGQVYVRTWYRRETGWFGHVLATHRACIRVPGLEAGVAIEDIGQGTPELRAGIDAAYGVKYGRGGGTERMVTAEAAAATLRLSPDTEAPSDAISGARRGHE
jgi:hypothetical protein